MNIVKKTETWKKIVKDGKDKNPYRDVVVLLELLGYNVSYNDNWIDEPTKPIQIKFCFSNDIIYPHLKSSKHNTIQLVKRGFMTPCFDWIDEFNNSIPANMYIDYSDNEYILKCEHNTEMVMKKFADFLAYKWLERISYTKIINDFNSLDKPTRNKILKILRGENLYGGAIFKKFNEESELWGYVKPPPPPHKSYYGPCFTKEEVIKKYKNDNRYESDYYINKHIFDFNKDTVTVTDFNHSCFGKLQDISWDIKDCELKRALFGPWYKGIRLDNGCEFPDIDIIPISWIKTHKNQMEIKYYTRDIREYIYNLLKEILI